MFQPTSSNSYTHLLDGVSSHENRIESCIPFQCMRKTLYGQLYGQFQFQFSMLKIFSSAILFRQDTLPQSMSTDNFLSLSSCARLNLVIGPCFQILQLIHHFVYDFRLIFNRPVETARRRFIPYSTISTDSLRDAGHGATILVYNQFRVQYLDRVETYLEWSVADFTFRACATAMRHTSYSR